MKIKYSPLLALLALLSCTQKPQPERLLDEGISWELAQYRKENITDLHYGLELIIPEDKNEPITGVEEIVFTLKDKNDVVLDFKETTDKIHSITANGKECQYLWTNDHIVIPNTYLDKGQNKLNIDFTMGNQSINRRDEYLYTLFVPDRARTAFPCFDQPNLKARFSLQLHVPKDWKWVWNGCENKPIPTYLFAFAAGQFEFQTYCEKGVSIGAYHRETDTTRIAQLPDIMHQVVFSLNWLEEFTGVPYPFPKYDLVILPGFQFGGMEHVGATFYNDNTLFLATNATTDDYLNRTKLISHETSHMWFGDAVTMNWFDDVWTKEVFANYFAAEITEPLFPDSNHDLVWLKTYVNSAIAQDRTEGRTSIRQPLDNLKYAGLIYNNIIYNKAPVMMRKMVEMMGKEAFKQGIQKYVKTYLYGNATWNDLIEILDNETPVDLKSFSREWVDEAHWPQYTASNYLEGKDGKTYGFIELNAVQTDSLMAYLPTENNATARQALLMNLNENYLAGNITAEKWMNFTLNMLEGQWDELTYSSLINYLYEPLLEIENSFLNNKQNAQSVEERLWQFTLHSNKAVCTQMLRLLMARSTSELSVNKLLDLWQQHDSPLLNENDYTTLTYQLAIRLPQKANELINAQRQRISNPDRRAQFDFVVRAVSPRQEDRDALFEQLKLAENRRIEPWTLLVLQYLNHPLRQQESIKYIVPALELLPEIQRTGDIFFPANWCNALLAGHRSNEVHELVEQFIAEHSYYPELLIKKILQAKYMLDRQNEKGCTK